MFLRQLAIRKMAVDLAIPEKTIELVLKHSFEGAREAFSDNRSVEISGFGTFLVTSMRVKKYRLIAGKQIAGWTRDLERDELSETKKENRKVFIAKVKRELKHVNNVYA